MSPILLAALFGTYIVIAYSAGWLVFSREKSWVFFLLWSTSPISAPITIVRLMWAWGIFYSLFVKVVQLPKVAFRYMRDSLEL